MQFRKLLGKRAFRLEICREIGECRRVGFNYGAIWIIAQYKFLRQLRLRCKSFAFGLEHDLHFKQSRDLRASGVIFAEYLTLKRATKCDKIAN